MPGVRVYGARLATVAVSIGIVGALVTNPFVAWADPGPLTLRVDVSHSIGRTNENLVGVGATAAPPALVPLRVRTFRIDASLQGLVTCPTGKLDRKRLAALGRRIDTLDRAGAQIILIIDYMPPCLASLGPGDARDPTRRPPADPNRWQQLVAQLVTAMGPARHAIGKRPVRYYEVWNEPDLGFFQGTMNEFEQGLLFPEARAVAQVAAASHLDLRFGVCGCALLATGWLPKLLTAMRDAGLPVGFVSWHWYGNYPNVGPDGREPGVDPALYAALSGRNLKTTPEDLADQITQARASAQSILGSEPELVVDEWNLSAGGFDRRMDTNEAAAYQAASLVVMARAGLDRAVLYTGEDPQSLDADGHPLAPRYGGWGLLDRSGARKAAWYAQWMWQRLGPMRLASAQDPAEHVWSAAARDASGRHVEVLVSAFAAVGATGRDLQLVLAGLHPGRWRVQLYRVDETHTGSTSPATTLRVQVGGDRRALIRTSLPGQSVLLVRVARD